MAPNHHPTTLLDLLSNHLILSNIAPCLPPASLLSLALASKSLYSLVFVTHSAYTLRYLDLSHLQQKWTGSWIEDCLTRTFHKLEKASILSHVTTLILDGLSIPAKTLPNIYPHDLSNVRILSIRNSLYLSEQGVINMLYNLIRPSRPEGSLKLKALYYFTPFWLQTNLPNHCSNPQISQGVTDAIGSQLGQSRNSLLDFRFDPSWTNSQGVLFNNEWQDRDEWIRLIEACKGLIAFDTVICHHALGSELPPSLANVALSPDGCQKCHSAPEQPRIYGQTPAHDLPLLSPPPLFASTVKAAQCLTPGENPKLYARCTQCLQDRRCERCNAWWCEDCYTPPSKHSEGAPKSDNDIKVHMGLCVQKCLVEELYTGVGEGGMWG